MQLDEPPVLGYIPFGSTNDCAVNLNLPKNPLEAAVVAATGTARLIDVGLLNGKSFLYVAAFGAFSNVAYDTPQDLKNTLGHLAYIVEGIASLPTIIPYHLKLEYDDQVLEDDFFFGMVSNAHSIGGLKRPLGADVVLDDGLFEVDLVRKPSNIAQVAGSVQSLLRQNLAQGTSLLHFKTSSLTISCDRRFSWTIDGEFGGNRKVNHIVNRQRALAVIQGD
jgi:YegS/Rv2252/BmrU family lipid kinase